jgi:hypothetical protein
MRGGTYLAVVKIIENTMVPLKAVPKSAWLG